MNPSLVNFETSLSAAPRLRRILSRTLGIVKPGMVRQTVDGRIGRGHGLARTGALGSVAYFPCIHTVYSFIVFRCGHDLGMCFDF
jgi:hypothetical protein